MEKDRKIEWGESYTGPAEEALPGYHQNALQPLPADLQARLVERLGQWDSVVLRTREHFKKKNLQYGDAITRSGVLGTAVEFVGISSRLDRMVINAADSGRSEKEKLQEVYMDALNYVIIGLIGLEMDNWEGVADARLVRSLLDRLDLTNDLNEIMGHALNSGNPRAEVLTKEITAKSGVAPARLLNTRKVK